MSKGQAAATRLRSITPDDVLGWRPCWKKPGAVVEAFLGKESATPMEICDAEHVSVGDRLWLLFREGVIPEEDLHELACKFAEEVLPVFEEASPGDTRPRAAIEAKRAWLRGEVSHSSMVSAHCEARASIPSEDLPAGWAADCAWRASGPDLEDILGSRYSAAWAMDWRIAEPAQLALVRQVLVRLEAPTQ